MMATSGSWRTYPLGDLFPSEGVRSRGLIPPLRASELIAGSECLSLVSPLVEGANGG